jgi:hypothetical protein
MAATKSSRYCQTETLLVATALGGGLGVSDAFGQRVAYLAVPKAVAASDLIDCVLSLSKPLKAKKLSLRASLRM